MNSNVQLGANSVVGALGNNSVGKVDVKRFYTDSTWWWGVFWGFVLGIPSSYLASWIWAVFPMK